MNANEEMDSEPPKQPRNQMGIFIGSDSRAFAFIRGSNFFFYIGRSLPALFNADMPLRHAFILALGVLASGCASVVPGKPAKDFNSQILAAVRTMPGGGGYDGSDPTKNLLHAACSMADGEIRVNPNRAKPSFCSGATYLVLLKALGTGPQALLPEIDQKDGHGIFGRWNSNGPGAAKLVADLGVGKNFTPWDEAQPGDFLKIWWTDRIGGSERGHLVVYLGHNAGTVRFWSSNQPGGYGTRSVARSDCKRVLFTRITRPGKFAAAQNLPATDPWLARMLHDDFTWAEVAAKCRVSKE
jgi:hypothetical protein